MFIFFACPKKINQKKGPPFTWFRNTELSCAAHKKQMSRKVADAPSSHFSAFCCAARLREIAKNYKAKLVFWDPFCPAEHRSCWRIKTLELSEAQPSFSASRQQQEAQESPEGRDSRVPFWVRFWANKNERT
jgi:hypothetical protein